MKTSPVVFNLQCRIWGTEEEFESKWRGRERKEERIREMGVQSLFVDSWIREAQEASRLVENLETKIENNPRKALGATARSNLFELGIKLDRLESLLHNPPSKPIL